MITLEAGRDITMRFPVNRHRNGYDDVYEPTTMAIFIPEHYREAWHILVTTRNLNKNFAEDLNIPPAAYEVCRTIAKLRLRFAYRTLTRWCILRTRLFLVAIRGRRAQPTLPHPATETELMMQIAAVMGTTG